MSPMGCTYAFGFSTKANLEWSGNFLVLLSQKKVLLVEEEQEEGADVAFICSWHGL